MNDYLDDRAATLTDEQRTACAFAANRFGTGQHPVVTAENLRYVAVPYLRACLQNMATSNKVTPAGRAAARGALAALAAAE